MQSLGLSWEVVLTTYQYTANVSIGNMLKTMGCPDEAQGDFMDTLKQMRSLKK